MPESDGHPVGEFPESLGSTSFPSQIYDILEDAIIDGVLRPGQRLRAGDIAARYGISRIPVREALRLLEAAGWVEIRPHYGASVTFRSDDELTDLFDVRAVLEGHAAHRAARYSSGKDIAELQQAVLASRAAANRGDYDAMSRQNAHFYSMVWRAAHNAVLASTLATLAKRARFYFTTVSGELGRGWIDVHQQLLDAIEAQDAEKSAAIARDHVRDTGAAVRRLLIGEQRAAGD